MINSTQCTSHNLHAPLSGSTSCKTMYKQMNRLTARSARLSLCTLHSLHQRPEKHVQVDELNNSTQCTSHTLQAPLSSSTSIELCVSRKRDNSVHRSTLSRHGITFAHSLSTSSAWPIHFLSCCCSCVLTFIIIAKL